MKFRAALKTNPANLLDIMSGAGWKREMGKQLEDAGNKAVQFARSTFRRGASATSTAVRSGRLLRSYGHEVRDVGRRGFELDYGPIRSQGGDVVKHARIHEGYNAAGEKVSQFVIRPRKGRFGRFPVRVGGGLAKGGIVGWRTYTRENPVILRPRPTFPAVEARLTAELPERGRAAFRRLFGEA